MKSLLQLNVLSSVKSATSLGSSFEFGVEELSSPQATRKIVERRMEFNKR